MLSGQGSYDVDIAQQCLTLLLLSLTSPDLVEQWFLQFKTLRILKCEGALPEPWLRCPTALTGPLMEGDFTATSDASVLFSYARSRKENASQNHHRDRCGHEASAPQLDHDCRNP